MIRSFTKAFSGFLHQRPNHEAIGLDSALELVVIHVPKTAGQSLNAILRKVYGDDKVIHIRRRDMRKDDALLRTIAQKNLKVLHGHFTYAEISSLLGEIHVPVLTWLRDPVERVISNYYFFIKRIRRKFTLYNYARRNETLLEYASREDTRNRATKFLHGIALRDLFFVGFTESFTDDLETLSQLLGWESQKPIRLNVNKEYKLQFGPISPETRAEIARLNEEDIALYEEALRMRGISRRH